MKNYTGEIRLFGGNFAPREWMFCHGQSLEIAQHSGLFSLLGTKYGGDGRQTFNLPDFRGKGANPSASEAPHYIIYVQTPIMR